MGASVERETGGEEGSEEGFVCTIIKLGLYLVAVQDKVQIGIA